MTSTREEKIRFFIGWRQRKDTNMAHPSTPLLQGYLADMFSECNLKEKEEELSPTSVNVQLRVDNARMPCDSLRRQLSLEGSMSSSLDALGAAEAAARRSKSERFSCGSPNEVFTSQRLKDMDESSTTQECSPYDYDTKDANLIELLRKQEGNREAASIRSVSKKELIHNRAELESILSDAIDLIKSGDGGSM
jgi:hypothetical protein